MSEKAIQHIHQNLVNQARRYSRTAQSDLYNLYHKAVFNSCFRIVNDTFIAEDIMHDAFIQAFKNLRQFDEKSTFGSWLKKIAINLSINHLKREKLISEKLEDYKELHEEEEEEVLLSFNFTVDEIKQALVKMPTNYKLVFSLYLIEGYDHEEIGKIMNISSSTSRSQLSRAKKQIKVILEQSKHSTL